MDGGVRLNAPLKPAIALGARRLVVVATDPPFHRPSAAAAGRPAPSIQDATGQLLHGAMADRMIEDLIVLAKLNKLLASGGGGARSRSGRPYQVIPFVFGSPDTLGTLGATAEQVLGEVLRGAGKLRHLDLTLLAGLLGAGPASRGDLLSYLFFEPAFMDAAIRLGRRDGETLLHRPPLWKDVMAVSVADLVACRASLRRGPTPAGSGLLPRWLAWFQDDPSTVTRVCETVDHGSRERAGTGDVLRSGGSQAASGPSGDPELLVRRGHPARQDLQARHPG
jgi:diadenosine tetraphosphatase ApaH/serine/threonine PP2A family protein phosphatase